MLSDDTFIPKAPLGRGCGGHSPVLCTHILKKHLKGSLSSIRRHQRLLEKGMLFQHQSPLRVPNFWNLIKINRCKKWTFSWKFYIFFAFSTLLVKKNVVYEEKYVLWCTSCFIWTSPGCVLYNNKFVTRKTLAVSFTPLRVSNSLLPWSYHFGKL